MARDERRGRHAHLDALQRLVGHFLDGLVLLGQLLLDARDLVLRGANARLRVPDGVTQTGCARESRSSWT